MLYLIYRKRLFGNDIWFGLLLAMKILSTSTLWPFTCCIGPNKWFIINDCLWIEFIEQVFDDFKLWFDKFKFVSNIELAFDWQKIDFGLGPKYWKSIFGWYHTYIWLPIRPMLFIWFAFFGTILIFYKLMFIAYGPKKSWIRILHSYG